jgi:hypothetical protein
MPGEIHSEMQCAQVEALLAEILDGTLQGATLTSFEAHQQSCASCRTMVDEARAGMHWLSALDEAEPPRNLVHNILAQTIGALPSEHAPAKPRGEGWLEKIKGRLAPIFAPIATPRFAMSMGMAFFSVTLLLGIAGFHFADVRHWDVSSKGIRRTYYEAQARVMRYYENMRVVYEIESRVRDLRRAGTRDQNAQPQPQPQQQQQEAPAPNQKNPSKSENRQHGSQRQNYSRDNGEPMLATFPAIVAVIALPVGLKGHAFRRAETMPYFSERALAGPQQALVSRLVGFPLARDIPQARQRSTQRNLNCLGCAWGPQQTPPLSLLGWRRIA